MFNKIKEKDNEFVVRKAYYYNIKYKTHHLTFCSERKKRRQNHRRTDTGCHQLHLLPLFLFLQFRCALYGGENNSWVNGGYYQNDAVVTS